MRRGFVFACLLAPAVASADVYEIRPGDDLAARLRTLVAGDEVIVHAGTYATGGPLVVTWAGTEREPILVRAAPGARPVLTGVAGQSVIDAGGAHFTLSGLELRGGLHGVRLAASDHATLEDLVLRDLDDAGIACDRPGQACTFLAVRRTEIYDTGKTAAGDGVRLGCVAQIPAACSVNGAILERNFIHDLAGAEADGIELAPGVANAVVRDNVIVRAPRAGIAIGGFSINAAPTLVERNLVWSVAGDGIALAGQARVYSNIVLAAGATGIRSAAVAGAAPRDLEIANNTVVAATSACFRASDWAGAADQQVANNALYCEGAAAIEITGDAPGARWIANVGRGTSNAPLGGFVLGRGASDDFGDAAAGDVFPRAGLPLEDAGSAPDAPRTDFDGCARNVPADVGAYERSGAGERQWAVAEGFKPVANCGAVGAPDAGVGGDMTPPGDGGCCGASGGGGGAALAALSLLGLLRRRRR